MLEATTAGELHRPPRTADGESPLASGRAFTEPLEYDGSENSPDEFDVRERIPLDFTQDSPQRAGKRAKKLEQLLDEHNADLERVNESDSAEATDADGESDGEGGDE